jgi:hypothetical protein
MPGIGAGAASGSAAGAGAVVFGIERRGADRFLAFFVVAFFAVFFAAGFRAAAFLFATFFFFFLLAGAARFIFFALVFDFFRFFAMIVLRSLRLNFQYGPACLHQAQHAATARTLLLVTRCKARARSVPLRVPPRQYAP